MPIDLRLGDCRGPEGLPSIAEGTIPLIFADPPYGASDAHATHWPERGYTSVNASWDRGKRVPLPSSWIPLAVRALKPGGSICVTCSFHNEMAVGVALMFTLYCETCGTYGMPAEIPIRVIELFTQGYNVNWKVVNKLAKKGSLLNESWACCPECLGRRTSALSFKNRIIWFRDNAIPLKHALQAQIAAYSQETLFYFRRRGAQGTFNYYDWKAMNEGVQMRDVWKFPWRSSTDKVKGFRATKPYEMLDRVIKGLSNPGDVVVDPFIGSGTTALVAAREGRDFIGWEMLKRHLKIAEQRIEKDRIDRSMIALAVDYIERA